MLELADLDARMLQSMASTALFTCSAFTFFFLVAVHRSRARSRWIRFAPAIVWIAYGYAMFLTFVHWLGGSGSLPPPTQSLPALLVPILAYRAGRRFADWIDSGHAWTLIGVLVASLLGGCAVRLVEYSPPPGFGPTSWPSLATGIERTSRAGSVIFDGGSLWSQELDGPLRESVFDVAGLVALCIFSALVLRSFRSRIALRGVPVALMVYPALVHRWVAESSICFGACLVLAYAMDAGFHRQAGRLRGATKLALTFAAFIAAVTVANLLVWKFAGVASLPRWDIVCLGYGAAGLALGRAAALWKDFALESQRPHVSFDEALIRSNGLQPNVGLPIRFDAVAALLPYACLGMGAVLLASLRDVRISALALAIVLAPIGAFAAVVFAIRVRAWLRTRQWVPVSQSRAETMRRFSATARRSARLAADEIAFLVLLPIVVPCAICLFTGLRSAVGIAAAGLIAAAAIAAGRYAIAFIQSLPPAVLVLGSSRAATVRLHASISRSIAPLRAVSMLSIDGPTVGDELPPRRDCLRTIWQDDWLEMVRQLSALAPIIVLDGRHASEPTRQELRALDDAGRRSACILVRNDDGTAPLLDPQEAIGPARFLSVVPESAIGEVLHSEIARRIAAGVPAAGPVESSYFSENAGGGLLHALRSACATVALCFAAIAGLVGFGFTVVVPALLALSILFSPLIIAAGLYWGFIPTPRSWGPAPAGEAMARSRDAVDKLDGEANSDVAARVAAMRTIFDVQDLASMIRAQEVGLTDPAEEVRVEALHGLTQCLRDNPWLLVEKNLFGWKLHVNVRLDLLGALAADPSPRVRTAVAELCRDVHEFADEREEILRRMLADEQDTAVRKSVEEALEANR